MIIKPIVGADIHIMSRLHIWVDHFAGWLDRSNVTVWKKMLLWTLHLFNWLGRNGNGHGQKRDEDDDV